MTNELVTVPSYNEPTLKICEKIIAHGLYDYRTMPMRPLELQTQPRLQDIRRWVKRCNDFERLGRLNAKICGFFNQFIIDTDLFDKIIKIADKRINRFIEYKIETFKSKYLMDYDDKENKPIYFEARYIVVQEPIVTFLRLIQDAEEYSRNKLKYNELIVKMSALFADIKKNDFNNYDEYLDAEIKRLTSTSADDTIKHLNTFAFKIEDKQTDVEQNKHEGE